MMTRKVLLKILLVAFIFGFSNEVDAQFWKKKKKETPKIAPKPKPKKGDIQPYSKVVTKDHKTDDGLFKVHKKDDSYLFEIPDSLLKREMLMVTRIAKTANGLGFGGGKTNTQVLRWERKNKKILLRIVSYDVVADTILPVHEAVVNSNLEPILFSFPIKAISKDSTATVIDATALFSTDKFEINCVEDYHTENWKKLIESATLGALLCLTGETCWIFKDEKMEDYFRKQIHNY